MARPRQFSDEDILATARECFLSHGPGVSTTHIAGELGMSQAALFKRFGTKEDLMIAALLPKDPVAWVALLDGGPDPQRSVQDQLHDVALAALSNFGRVMPCFATLKAGGVEPSALMKRFDVPPPLRAQLALARWFEAARDQGRVQTTDPGSLAMLFLSAMHSRSILRHILGVAVGTDEDYVRGVLSNLWNGLAPRGAS